MNHLQRVILFWVAISCCGGIGCERAIFLPSEKVDPKKVGIVVQAGKERKPAAGQTRVLGTGWYANVEIDSQDRIHFSWVDADLGDVYYAVTDPGGVEPGPAQPVEVRGAAGSYLQMALGNGDSPVLLYYHQDSQALRMAHREADLVAMKAAGADVALLAASVPVANKGARKPANSARGKDAAAKAKDSKAPAAEKKPSRMAEGWLGETVAVGDNVGMAAKLRIDGSGRPHLVYRTKGEKLHYARRAPSLPAFGEGTMGKFDISVVDSKAGASYTMSSDMLLLPDQTLVISYCHWNYVDSSLKLAILPGGQESFTVLKLPMEKQVDGWHSGLLLNQDGTVGVYSVATGDRKMYHFNLKMDALEVPKKREIVMERPGASVIKRAPDGTIWILTRGHGIDSLNEPSGVWLVQIPQGNKAAIKRLFLDSGAASDPWIDMALRRDGRPVAVWTAANQQSMRIYAP
jgi:hypothetical protein